VVNTKDYISYIELKDDNKDRYDIIEKLLLVITGIILITINYLKNDNKDFFQYYLSSTINYDIDNNDLSFISVQDLEYIIVMIYNYLLDVFQKLYQKDQRLMLFDNYTYDLLDCI
jgi:hypothetical protein